VHSFDGRRRWWNLRRSDPWQERIGAGVRPVEQTESLGGPALALEALMTGLRTHAGVDLARIRSRWDVDLASRNTARIERLEAAGLLTVRGERLVPTLRGLAVADSVAASFDLPGEAAPI
jgi:oxygen-independent coproporphyrinogen-3 oxidase